MDIKLFCSDLDGTLVGNPEGTQRFTSAWEALGPKRPLLCYSSGRLLSDARDLLKAEALPRPDYLITGVGTEIYDHGAAKALSDYPETYRGVWDLEKVEAVLEQIPGIARQPAEFSHAHKSSWFLHNATPSAIQELEEKLRTEGIDATVVYSSARDLDVLPGQASKGHALQWLCQHLNIPLDRVLVAGDTGNDVGMFLLPGVRGIVVENAQPELLEATVKLPVFVTGMQVADGVIEGLRHYGVIEDTPERPIRRRTRKAKTPRPRFLIDERASDALSESEIEVIQTGFQKAKEAIEKNITPMGFSACSLDDNPVTGTDANYRSVWARDGCFTIISTILLDDEHIRQAQRQTLQTLFQNTSERGLLPAYVRLADGEPDYSGVGGICSIDGCLWGIIAFYQYVKVTGDLDLLAEHRETLQRTMDWLAAHDSNENGLLEIPEAGDWTDLFGRSYNVLYDEVLWYRANVLYGRLLELANDYENAGKYLRHAQLIRSRVLSVFWPTTRIADDLPPVTFAEQQYSVGDASYLLAEITPFSFSWRCDVLGNILAYLFNLLSIDHARTAFNFMWGVGVNEPYPVANLYPAVQAGDPDWRAYYTVNLLNLPHHYHNGGIWPFIGGLWVRFIHRLGMSDVAARELYKLAQLNRLGRTDEWEFTEWAHGNTGRPMGKRYQAWSAASYIRACHELQLPMEEEDA